MDYSTNGEIRYYRLFKQMKWRNKMKYVIVIEDGAADYPLKEIDGKTPLKVANKPVLDRIAKEGKTAQREENTESYLINKALNSSETSGSTNTGNWHTFRGNDGQQYVQIRSGSSTRYILTAKPTSTSR